MTFDEQNPRPFDCVDTKKDTENDEVEDKPEIRNYTFHDQPGYHPGHENNALNFPDIDGDGLRAEGDCDSDNDAPHGDFDGGEDIDGDGYNPEASGLPPAGHPCLRETCQFDPSDFCIMVHTDKDIYEIGESVFVVDVHGSRETHTYHENSLYRYEWNPGPPLKTDSNNIAWMDSFTTGPGGHANQDFVMLCEPPGLYHLYVDVLADHHYSDPDNWDPFCQWYCKDSANPVEDSIGAEHEIQFDWYMDGEPYPDMWVYGYTVDGMANEVLEAHVGSFDFRDIHPEFEGFGVKFSFYRPPGADAWRQTITCEYGVSDVWAIDPGDILPGDIWRIPDLVPGPNEQEYDTIYTLVDMPIYLQANPLGFNGGAWDIGFPISEYGVEIIDGMAEGLEGIQWATTPFVPDKSLMMGYSPSGGHETYLNSGDFPTLPIIIAQHSNDYEPGGSSCCDLPGDADNNGLVNILDMTYLIAYLYKGGPAPICIPEGDINGNGQTNILDVIHLLNYLYNSGPAPICP